MEKVSFSSDTMELWQEDGKALRIDLSLPHTVVAQRLELLAPKDQEHTM